MKLRVPAVLDPKFEPLSLVCREMREKTKDNGQDLIIGCQRNKGYTTIYNTRIFKDGTGHDEENFRFVERITKALLWVVGGYKIIIAGSPVIGEKIKEAYKDKSLRDFDNHFMARVYERPFEVEVRSLENAPETYESASPVGRHLDGCRIGLTRAEATERSAPLSTARLYIPRRLFGIRSSTATPPIIIRAFLRRLSRRRLICRELTQSASPARAVISTTALWSLLCS
jgi:hypothetical protein